MTSTEIRGDAERTAIVEEDAAERRQHEAEQRAEVAAELTAEQGRENAEQLHAADAIVITAEVARNLARTESTRDFWIAYADRLDELTGPSPHVTELEECYARALAAMVKVQTAADRMDRWDGEDLNLIRFVLRRDLADALAAFQGEQS